MDLIRQLKFEDKPFWDKKLQITSEMEENKDCDPTMLSGWTDRDISLWDVSAGDGKPGLYEILFALCRSKDDWVKISYLKFSDDAVVSTGLSLTQSFGKTSDIRVNNSRTHYEIKGITGKELCTLLFNIYNSNFETGVFTKKEFNNLLLDIYDKTKIQQIVNGSTSQLTNISEPSSGTGMQESTTLLQSSQGQNKSSTLSQLPKSSSSTTEP